MTIALYALLFAAGYVASVYSWPAVRIWFIGEYAELTSLRRKMGDLELKMRRTL